MARIFRFWPACFARSCNFFAKRGGNPLSHGLRSAALSQKAALQMLLSVTTPPVKRQFWKILVCVAMKAPVGLSSRRAVCVSRWKGFALTSVRTATNAKNKNQIPLNMPRVQQRRPLPAAEAGRSCWGRGQQDTNAAQGMKWMLGAATLGGHSKSFNQR